MVRNALNSIRDLDYDDWHLAFIDDGSTKPGRPAVEAILADHLDKVSFYNTNHTPDDKFRQGGSAIGQFMNQITQKYSKAPVNCEMAIMLCDDDALHPDYFTNLKQWSEENPKQHYTYSHVILFDPFIDNLCSLPATPLIKDFHGKKIKFDRFRNKFNKTQELYPEAKLDASQVAWRTYCANKAHFPARQTCHLDSSFYKQLGAHYGRIKFSGFIGQYKGMHDDTLSIRDEARQHYPRKNNVIYKVKDLDNT